MMASVALLVAVSAAAALVPSPPPPHRWPVTKCCNWSTGEPVRHVLGIAAADIAAACRRYSCRADAHLRIAVLLPVPLPLTPHRYVLSVQGGTNAVCLGDGAHGGACPVGKGCECKRDGWTPEWWAAESAVATRLIGAPDEPGATIGNGYVS